MTVWTNQLIVCKNGSSQLEDFIQHYFDPNQLLRATPNGRVFAPLWSENGYRLCPFWSGIVWFWTVMFNTVDMIRVEKYFSQLNNTDKLLWLDIQSCWVENSSHDLISWLGTASIYITACLHEGGGPQVGEVTARFTGVTCLSI